MFANVWKIINWNITFTSVFRPFTQYIVEAHLAVITASSFSHSSLQILPSTVRLDGERVFTAIFKSLQRCLIGLKTGLWLGHSRTFRELSRSHSYVILAVCLGSLSCWKMNLSPSLTSWALWSRFSARIFLYFALFIFPSTQTSLPIPATEKHPHSMMITQLCFTVKMVPGFLQMWRLAFRPKSSILFSSDQRNLFLMIWESFRFLLANSKRGVICLLLGSGFHLATLP